MICLTDYDKDNAKTQAKVDEFMTYVDQYNKDVAALNATYEAFFFGWLPSSSKHFGS